LRPVVHPGGIKDRTNGEHWAGRLYMREISLRCTRVLVDSRLSPNQYTYLMILAGVAAGAVLLVPGLAGGILAALLIQLYLLLDCVDGELARWRGQTSTVGVYLDRVGHYLSEAALLVGFGVRAADVFRPDGAAAQWQWAFLGTLAALGAILIKAETDLVDVARTRRGLPAAGESSNAPRSAGMVLARRAASALKFHRLVGGVEASLLILVAAVADVLHGDLLFTRVAVVLLAAVAVAQTLLHLVSILASGRLT
jgi:phosphatidylglycerophosphate synthase